MFGSASAREFMRYFLASLCGLILDTGTLAVLTSGLGVPYLISGSISFVLGICAVYLLSIYWVFERRDVRSRAVEFSIFLLIGLVGLAINDLVLWALTDFFGLFYLVSKLASVFVVFTWNFFARKKLLFR